MDSRKEFYIECQTKYLCSCRDNADCGRKLLCPRLIKKKEDGIRNNKLE